MKKLFAKLVLFTIISILLASINPYAYAADDEEPSEGWFDMPDTSEIIDEGEEVVEETVENIKASCTKDEECGTNEVCENGKCMHIIEGLVPVPDEGEEEKYEELTPVSDLPRLSLEETLATIIKVILAMAGSLTIIALVVTGIFYLTARGEEEEITKAKNILKYLVIGMAIIAAAYGIVAGISQFEFFK
jgi:hypothetical protein